jgi:hypothetical protein
MKSFFFFSFLLFCYLFTTAQLNFINSGASSTEILITKNADSLTLAAAEKLQDYLFNISGAKLNIKTAKKSGKNSISIGRQFLEGEDKSMLTDDVKGDAFVIISKNERIFLAGKNPIGDLYAVTTFLEEFLGCIKFTVDEEYIPKLTDISIPAITKVYNTAFAFRVPHFIGRWDGDFSDWHKISSFDTWGMFVHTFDDLIPPDIYFENHPEYYALVNGRRLSDGQLCLSNKDLMEELIKNLGDRMEAEPEKVYWSVSQNDCYNYCECDGCQKLYDKYESISGAYVQMANEIAAVFPDKQISTLAYQFTRSAPKNIIPRENVNIMFCSIECNRSMPLADDPRSAGFVNEMKDWDKLTDNIFAWDYIVQFNNYLTPFPNFHVLQPNIQFFYENGVNMMFQQGSGHSWSDLSDLKQYLVAKLLWYPYLDADSVVNHFINNYYGDAAKFIREYYDLTHQNLIEHQDEQVLDIYGFPVYYKNSFLTPDLLLIYQELMDEAELAVADDSILLKRVARVRVPADFALIDLACNSNIFNQDEVARLNISSKLDEFVANCDFTGINTINERSLLPRAYADFTKKNLEWQAKENILAAAKIKCLTTYSPKYPVGGKAALTDKLMGGLHFRFNWLGFEGEDMVLEADLGERKQFSCISMNFLKDVGSWVFLPEDVLIEVSEDGVSYTKVASHQFDNSNRHYLVESVPLQLNFPKVEARYLRITAKSMLTCPEWHRGYGMPSWIFCDEVILE